MITANVDCTTPKNHYNLLNHNDFTVPFAITVYHGTAESTSYLGPKIWDIASIELKQVQFIYSFKKSIRKCVPNNCPSYIQFMLLNCIYLSQSQLGQICVIKLVSRLVI